MDLHDWTGVHTIVPPITGVSSDSFTVPQTGDLSPSVFYRITHRDRRRGAEPVTRRSLSAYGRAGLITQPAGFTLSLDGQSQATPGSVAGVSGMIRSLQAPVTEVVGGVIYQFAGWSDGVATAWREVCVFPSTINTTSTLAAYQAIGIVPYVTVNNASRVGARGESFRRVAWFSADRSTPLPRRTGPITGWFCLAGIVSSGRRDDRSCSLSLRGLPGGSQHREAGAVGSTDHARRPSRWSRWVPAQRGWSATLTAARSTATATANRVEIS